MIKLEYGGIVRTWRFEWGALYLWRGVRVSQFGKYEYGYITVYVRAKFVAAATGVRRWLQRTVYVGKDVVALAGRLVATAPWLSWGEALKKAKEVIKEVIGQIEAVFSGLKAAKRDFRSALFKDPDVAEAKFDALMEGIEYALDNMRRTLKDVLAELPDT